MPISERGGGYDFNEKESGRLRTIDEGPREFSYFPLHFVNGKMTLTNWFVTEKKMRNVRRG